MSSFERHSKGPSFQKDSSIYSLFFGTRAKLLEDEMNELQWTLIENIAAINRGQRSSGTLNTFQIAANTANQFQIHGTSVLSILIDGYLLKAGANEEAGRPPAYLDNRLHVNLNASGAVDRTDLVILEAWFESVKHGEDIRKFGGETTPLLPNTILDSRANQETSRRVQFKWRLRSIDNETSPDKVVALKPNGSNSGVNFTKLDDLVYMADIGLQRDDNMDVKSTGIVYCVPIATVKRKANDNVIKLEDITVLLKTSESRFPSLSITGGLKVDGPTILNDTLIEGKFETVGDLTVGGDLIVNGTTTYLNTTELQVTDNIITLNGGATGTPSLNSGLEINRGTSPKTSLIWNETTDRWTLTNDGTNFHNILTPNDNIATATKLRTARTISLTGDATGSVVFDGSNNVNLNVNITDNSHEHTIANITGLETELNNKVTGIGVPTFMAGDTLPTDNSAGRVFINTVDKKIYRDNGTGWDMVGGSETIEWTKVTNVPNASTTVKGVVQLNNTLASTSTTLAATAGTVKQVNDKITNHVNSTNNPHNVTSEQINGLPLNAFTESSPMSDYPLGVTIFHANLASNPFNGFNTGYALVETLKTQIASYGVQRLTIYSADNIGNVYERAIGNEFLGKPWGPWRQVITSLGGEVTGTLKVNRLVIPVGTNAYATK